MKWYGAFVYSESTGSLTPINTTADVNLGTGWFAKLDGMQPAGSKLSGRMEEIWVIVEVDDEA